MRVWKMILVSAATLLVPALASADPAQTQTAPAATAQTGSTTMPTVTVTSPRAPQAAPAPAASTASDPDEVVCRMSPAATGSRLGGARECHTAREWDNRMRESQRVVNGTQMMGLAGPLSGPGGK
jgi:hypothetical protein